MTQAPLIGNTFFGINISALLGRVAGFRRRISKRLVLLEFTAEALTIAEARLSGDVVDFHKFRKVPLPDGAVERGTPTDPAKMADLLRDLCKEAKLFGHRAAVVLPAGAVFMRLVDLPVDMTLQQARDFIGNPSSGLQIPIPILQTDFDLLPTNLPARSHDAQLGKPYLLTCIPQKLVDQLLQTLQAADLELHALEISVSAQMRLYAAQAAMLTQNECIGLLDLTPDCTHFTMTSASGPLWAERITAVREFPQPERTQEQSDAALSAGVSAESLITADPNYLPLTSLELDVFLNDLQNVLQRFQIACPATHCQCLYLTGSSSAHPMIAELIHDRIQLPVRLLSIHASVGVGAFSCDHLLVHRALSSLVGLGLRLLPPEALVACSIADPSHATSSYATDQRLEPPSRPEGEWLTTQAADASATNSREVPNTFEVESPSDEPVLRTSPSLELIDHDPVDFRPPDLTIQAEHDLPSNVLSTQDSLEPAGQPVSDRPAMHLTSSLPEPPPPRTPVRGIPAGFSLPSA